MKLQTILLYSILMVQIATKCTNQLSCFRNKLFNFGSPGQSIYMLDYIASNNSTSTSNVLAYGDFNNDLHTDFVTINVGNPQTLYMYVWNADNQAFDLNQTLNASQCPVSSVFLYDMDLNGLLDIVIWGSVNNQSCILPYNHLPNNTYSPSSILTMQSTSNPIVISYGPDNNQRTIGLLVFMNGSRALLKYQVANQNFITIGWGNIFSSSNSFASVPFASPHWNSFLDVTGDCQSDVIIVNSNNSIQVWTLQQQKFVYQNSLNLSNFISLSFADMNYDGAVDMVVAYPSSIDVLFNSRVLENQVDFCNPKYTSVTFNSSLSPLFVFPDGYTMSTNILQIKDINIDGYPDVLVPLSQQGSQISNVSIYLNIEAQRFQTNDQYVLPEQNFNNIVSASFIDFWENGIMDIIVCTNAGLFAFYNNYLQQNLFFIKGYGASGDVNNVAAQIVGGSFYWVNSVGDKYRTTYQPQIIQTAYNALQTPYSYCGLGRANNYVESFTLGMYGQSNSWSPIIPNSQLAVYAEGATPSQWKITVYVLPNQSLIYVIIVSAAVLTILGLILLGLKCKNYRKKDQPLMQFIH